MEGPLQLFGNGARTSMEQISRSNRNGISEVVLLLKSEMPNQLTPNSYHEVRLDELYTAKVDFCPNEEDFDSEGWASLVVTLFANEDTEVFGKIECALICTSGRKAFHQNPLDFIGMATGIPVTIPNIANVNILRDRIDYYLHDDAKIHFEVKISIDRNRSIEIFQIYKRRFADSDFGDTTFNVGGVLLHGHLEILKKQNEGFREMFYSEANAQYLFYLPNEAPREFVHHMAYCYLAEGIWNRVAHDYLNPMKEE